MISPQVDRKRVAVLESTFNLLISTEPLRSRVTDLAVCWRETMVRDENDILCSPPDLVVEVLSPSENKRRKLEDYARLAVPEVWIVSPEAQHIEIWLAADNKMNLNRIIAEGTLEPCAFPRRKDFSPGNLAGIIPFVTVTCNSVLSLVDRLC